MSEFQIDDEGSGKNDRSTIEFPYYDLESAIRIAQVIHERAGGRCSLDQLAALLEMAPNTGGFRARISPARTFGLITSERSAVFLTELGEQIVDPSHEAAARIEAFLTVPLYRALFDKFRSKLLPKTEGLERSIVELGVAPKQAGKARNAFERSAQLAGFFDNGKDRLIEPIRREVSAKTVVNAPAEIEQIPHRPVRESNNPLISGLFEKLPSQGSTWEEKDRIKWLSAANTIFDLLYEGEASITISSSRTNGT
jgi:hypothetical protein